MYDEIISLRTPGKENETVLLSFTSEYGRGGCEGTVLPARIITKNYNRPVQVKQFYARSTDDRGRDFCQEPNKKAQQSYESLTNLQKRGFKVIPYFALGTTQKGQNILIMDDLTREGTIGVYDEKYLNRQERLAKTIKNCSNWPEIELEFLRTNLLEVAHNISLGYGVCHMITRDPKTNKAGVFVTDVGECTESKYSGKSAKIINPKEFKLENPVSVYSEMIGDRKLAQSLLEEHKAENPIKTDFMELVHKAPVTLAFTDFWGGWADDPEWARKKFTKNKFDDKFMKIKLYTDNCIDAYERIRGERLFYCDKCDKLDFVSALNSREETGLKKGVDIAYQACIDNDLGYLTSVENAGKLIQRAPISIKNGLPHLTFLDDYFEKRNDKHILQVACTAGESRRDSAVVLSVDWKTGYEIAQSGYGRPSPIFFHPDQIQKICLRGANIPEFDINKVKIVPFEKTLFYLYGEEVFHTYFAESAEKLNDFISKVDERFILKRKAI